MQYTKRTCAKCGLRAPQREMNKRQIRVESGSSKRSLSNREVFFALAGSKSARKSLLRWATLPNQRTHYRKREVWLCADCATDSHTARAESPSRANLRRNTLWLLAAFAVFIVYIAFLPPSVDTEAPHATGRSTSDNLTELPNWCARAQTETEKTICGSAEVAALDLKMSTLFLSAKGQLGPGTERPLMQQQRKWLHTRDECGSDTNCMISVYEKRIAELNF
jgi:uncharacterized protein YecT (DUF1311 family)